MWQRWIEDLEQISWDIDCEENSYYLEKQYAARGRALVAMAKRLAEVTRQRDQFADRYERLGKWEASRDMTTWPRGGWPNKGWPR